MGGATPMKAYVITTGTDFALLTLAHIWRVVAEDARLAKESSFVLITLLAAGLSLWAWGLVRLSSRP